MRFLVQRVEEASVCVEHEIIGSIGHGLLVFVGVSDTDTEAIAERMVDKLVKLRIFDDADGKTNLSAADVQGEFLIISQFTLYADCRKGNRPSFTRAGKPDRANELYEYVAAAIRQRGFVVETGSFGAHMEVSLVNHGPFTVWLDSDKIVTNTYRQQRVN